MRSARRRPSAVHAAARAAARAARAAHGAGALVLLSAAALPAAELAVTGIDFTPAVNARLEDYGEAEAATVREAIRTALARERACGGVPSGTGITVTVEDLTPTRLTRKQLADNPSLDVVRSKSLGGAELRGEVRDAQQRLLASVSYRYFAPTLPLGSLSLDPWADARLAIDGFAAKLAGICRKLPPPAHSASG